MSPKHSSQQINAIMSRKLSDKQQNIIILEIKQNGESSYKEMSIRDLLIYIEKETDLIEQEAGRRCSTLGADSSSSSSGENGAGTTGLFSQFSNKSHHSSQSLEMLESGGTQNKRRQSIVNNTGGGGGGGVGGSSKTNLQSSTNGLSWAPSQGINSIKNRDLRRLEYQFNPLGDPVILVRRHVVLVSFDPVRAIVMVIYYSIILQHILQRIL